MSLASRSIDRPKLYRFAGDSLRLALLLVDPDTGAPFDPTGQVLLFTLKDDPTADDTAAIVQKISTVGGFTVTAAAAGAVDLQLVPADLAQLVVGVAYECDVQAQDAGTGAVKTVARFTLTLSQDVTRLTSLSIATVTTEPAVGFSWDNIPDKPLALQVDPGTPGGVATLDEDGLLDPAQIPSGLGGGGSGDTDVAAAIHAATAKATPIDADELGLVDSAASHVLKKLTWAALKATLKTYLDTLYSTFDGTYAALTGKPTLGTASAQDTAAFLAAAAAAADVNPAGTAIAAALAAKAPLASPTLTGTPAAPTAAPGTNSTQLATTAFIKAAIDALVAGAPGALDTLKEISDQLSTDESAVAALTTTVASKVPATRTVNAHALTADVTITKGDVGLASADNTSDVGKPVSTAQAAADAVVAAAAAAALATHVADDANPHGVTAAQVGLGSANDTTDLGKPISTATQTALDAKAPLASPSLTGTPTAPTPTAGDNSTKLATTAYADRAAAVAVYNTQTGDYTLVLADRLKSLVMNNAAAADVTIPANADVAMPLGTRLPIWAIGSGQVTIVGDTGVTLHGRAGAYKSAGQDAPIWIEQITADNWWVTGDVTT